ncbi:nucleoporin NUP35 [Hetaerina americana]|uniref:nucleoporin NUP35 n=1 Tax=Hetaerina americana TaxID=62018 RepID=UPI003A7F159E
MEPMALGSPVGSPAGTPSSPTTSPFLPSFLMGDTAPNVSTPRSSAQARQQTPKHVTFSTGSFAMPSSHLSNLAPQIGNSRSLQSVTSPAEKPTSDFGPPTLGLFDTLSPLPGAVVSSHVNNSSYLSHSGPFAGVLSPSHPTVITSPVMASQATSQLAPETLLFESGFQKGAKGSSQGGPGGGESETRRETDTWVTVFGFLPHAVNDILAHFVHCGTILEHRWGGGVVSEGGSSGSQSCNWIHLRFRTVREARRALGKNGKVFGGCMMVGVIPCQDVEILHNQKENIQGPEVNFPSQQRTTDGALSGIRPLGVDFTSPWKESPKRRSSVSASAEYAGIRPLMKTVTSPQNELQSSGSAKNNGLISKTIDFLFGQ